MNLSQVPGSLFCVAVGVVLLTSTAVNATIADYEAQQALNPNLVFQYGFEGSDDSTRLADGSGNGYTLQRTAGSAGGNVSDVQFVAGFDGSSQAYQPAFDTASYQTGAGLNTISTTVPVASSLTVETVIQLDSFVQPSDNTTGAYILSARPQPGNGRAYFLRQMADPTPRVTSTFGDTFGDVPPVLDYTPGDWYYLALTISYDSGGNQSTIRWYSANLSLGQTTLSLLGLDNTTFQGLFDGEGQIGVGNFVNGGQEFMQGRMDSVAMTSGILAGGTLQSHLDAIYIPEPSAFALLAIGGLGFLMRRIRR